MNAVPVRTGITDGQHTAMTGTDPAGRHAGDRGRSATGGAPAADRQPVPARSSGRPAPPAGAVLSAAEGATMGYVIEARGLTKVYRMGKNEVHALRGVT